MLVLGNNGIVVVAVGTEYDEKFLCTNDLLCDEEMLGDRKVVNILCNGYVMVMIVVDDDEYEKIKDAVDEKPEELIKWIFS